MRLEVDSLEFLYQKEATSYDLQQKDLKAKEVIIKLCQEIPGSYLIQKDLLRYEIFSSRGAINSSIRLIKSTIEDIQIYHKITLIGGIGFGTTAFDAQKNAFHALNHTRTSKTHDNLTSIDSNGKIIHYTNENTTTSINTFTNNQKLIDTLSTAGVTITTYLKIKKIAENKDTPFSAIDLASQLNVTTRNINRIISSLTEVGLIKNVGVSAPSGRGRPTKIYILAPISESH